MKLTKEQIAKLVEAGGFYCDYTIPQMVVFTPEALGAAFESAWGGRGDAYFEGQRFARGTYEHSCLAYCDNLVYVESGRVFSNSILLRPKLQALVNSIMAE